MIVFSKSFNTKSISLIHSFTDKVQLTWYSRDLIVQFTTFRLLFIIHFKPFRVPFKVQTKLRKAILFPIIPYCYSRHSVHIRTRCLEEYLNANMQAVTMCVFVKITNNASHDIILSRFQKYHDDYKPKSRFIFSSWKCEPYFTRSGTAMNSIKEYIMGFYFFLLFNENLQMRQRTCFFSETTAKFPRKFSLLRKLCTLYLFIKHTCNTSKKKRKKKIENKPVFVLGCVYTLAAGIRGFIIAFSFSKSALIACLACFFELWLPLATYWMLC